MLNDNLLQAKAFVTNTPSHDGDGYGWGGDTILVIAGVAIDLGVGSDEFANEIAARWNAGRTAYSEAAKLSQ